MELLVTLAVLAIVISSAQPMLTDMLESRRVAGAAEAVRSHLQLARSEAIKQTTAMTVTHAASGTTDWRFGIRPHQSCDPALADPTAVDACAIPVGTEWALAVISSANFPKISAHASRSATRFDPIRGMAMGSNVTLTLSSPGGKEARVIVSNTGRIRTCSPVGGAHVPGFAQC